MLIMGKFGLLLIVKVVVALDVWPKKLVIVSEIVYKAFDNSSLGMIYGMLVYGPYDSNNSTMCETLLAAEFAVFLVTAHFNPFLPWSRAHPRPAFPLVNVGSITTLSQAATVEGALSTTIGTTGLSGLNSGTDCKFALSLKEQSAFVGQAAWSNPPFRKTWSPTVTALVP